MSAADVREALKSPLETLPLFWANEAKAPAYHDDYQPLSVHGAYITGLEAAKDVRRFLKLRGNAREFAEYYRKKYDVTIKAKRLGRPDTATSEARSV